MWTLFIPPALTTIATFVAEYLSLPFVWKGHTDVAEFNALYRRAWTVSACNVWLVGPLLHYVVERYWVSRYKPFPAAYALTVMTLVQSFGYYAAHYAMHRYCYKIHALHHRFSAVVTPIAAITVSLSEYLFAYALPVIVSVYIAHPSANALTAFVTLEYLLTVYIHTPVGDYHTSTWRVNPRYHIHHHSKATTRNYAAPLLSLPDRLFGTGAS